MFIVWGTKRVLTELGYVADFCPLCREVRPFSISRVGRTGHIYYISFGEGELVGYLSECQTCRLNLSANPNLYQTLSEDLSSDLTSLIQETFPNLNQHYRNRLEVEEQIKRNPRSLPANIRSALIKEPFHLLSPLVEARLSEGTHFDQESVLGCLVTSIMLILLCALLGNIPDWLARVGWLVVLGGAVYTIMQLVLYNQKYLQREMVPLLASCLKPLNPNLDELQDCLNKLAIQKQRLGRRLKAQQLLTAIERLRSDSFHASSDKPTEAEASSRQPSVYSFSGKSLSTPKDEFKSSSPFQPPVAKPSPPKELDILKRRFLALLYGDQESCSRNIELERRRSPHKSDVELYQDAINRLERDRVR